MILPKYSQDSWTLGDDSYQYNAKYDGGGIAFAPFLLSYLNRTNRTFTTCLEVAAGLGFLGLSLLKNNIVSHLTLSDINQEVIDCVKHTPYINSDMLDNINGSYDIIIANLPYFSDKESYLSAGMNNKHLVDELIFLDSDWNLHKKLFDQAHAKLNDNGLLIIFGIKSELEKTKYFKDLIKSYKTVDIVNTWKDRQSIVLEKL